MRLPPRSTGRGSQAGSWVQSPPSGAAEAAGGRRLRRLARETWGHLHPPLHWNPPLNGWTPSGTVGMNTGACERYVRSVYPTTSKPKKTKLSSLT